MIFFQKKEHTSKNVTVKSCFTMMPAYPMCERDHIVLDQETSEYNKRCYQMVKAIGLSNKTRNKESYFLEIWKFEISPALDSG